MKLEVKFFLEISGGTHESEFMSMFKSVPLDDAALAQSCPLLGLNELR
jgi:hypothetical protein